MYTDVNFQTKKALKEALASGREIRCFSPGPFPCPEQGRVTLEGPHFPEPHRWYAVADVKNGVIVSVR